MVNTPGLGDFRGSGSRQGISLSRPAGSSQTPSQTPAQQALAQQQQRSNGLDFYAATQIAGAQTLQDPLPPLDFQWTWSTKDGKQRGFKFTISSGRAGLELQRGPIGLAHTRLSQSTLLTHAGDQITLPFATVMQKDQAVSFTNQMLVHSSIAGRAVMASYLDTAMKVEASVSDPTIINSQAFASIFGFANVTIQGQEHLAVLTAAGCVFMQSSLIGIAGPLIFNVTDDAAPPASGGGISLGGGSGGDGLVFPGQGWGGGQTTESFTGIAIIQSPLPGNPLIVRSSNAILLVPVEPVGTNEDPYRQTGALMLKNVGLGACQPVGFLRVGNLPPAGYFWEFSPGGVANPQFLSRIASVDAYGLTYTVHHQFDGDRILGVTALPERGGLGVTTGDRVLFWHGEVDDTRIFADEAPIAGFRNWATTVYERDGQLFAEVNELPYASGGLGQGRIRACKRRYDFELKRWSQVSEWVTLTESGFIQWSSGIPQPVAQLPAGPFGYMSAYGAPDGPVGPVTRAMHNYAVQARYNTDYTQTQPGSSSYDLTWYHKYEPPAATSPYSLRGSDRDFASGDGLLARWPAMIFPSGFEYADKYVDGIEWGGQDTGGAGSRVTIRAGEGGRMDETNPGPLHATFTYPVAHPGRWYPFANNETALLFPQFEAEITPGSDPTLTPQVLPFTIHGHVDLRDPQERHGWRQWGRSKG